jgi:hypothetical protein
MLHEPREVKLYYPGFVFVSIYLNLDNQLFYEKSICLHIYVNGGS